MPHQPETRAHTRNELSQQPWDVCIVGGGINGAGVFRDAVLRGLSACLLEKSDFGAGTSSRSSKLIHGGVRYLEQGHFRLVYEALAERSLWTRNAPHLVQPLTFMIPVYESLFDYYKYRLGLSIYDTLAAFGNIHKHLSLNPQRTIEAEPALRREGLVGSVVYADCMTDDARMTLECVLDGQQNGGLAMNYCQVNDFQRDDSGEYAVTAHDSIEGQDVTLRAKSIVNVTGAWCDKLRSSAFRQMPLSQEQSTSFGKKRLKPTKGVHIQMDNTVLGLNMAVLMFHPKDKRALFAIPRGEVLIIGTTDTYFDDDPDNLVTDRNDVDYLFEALAKYFPSRPIRDEDVISTYAGLRPLIHQESSSASSASREHEIHEELPGVFTMVGGKLTTYRRMAEEMLEDVQTFLSGLAEDRTTLPSKTGEIPLFQGEFDNPDTQAVEYFGKALGTGLWRRYGRNWTMLRDLVEERAELGQRLADDSPFILAEVVYAARHEMVTRLDDFMTRRSSLFFFHRDQGLPMLDTIVGLLAEELQWSPERQQQEKAHYLKLVDESRSFATDKVPAAV